MVEFKKKAKGGDSMKKKIVSLLLALCMLLCLFGCARKPDVLELTIDTESSF